MTNDIKQRWDASQPLFARDVLLTLIGCWLVISGIGAISCRREFLGLLTGGLLVIALYLIAFQAGSRLIQHKKFLTIMLALMAQQAIIWIAMAVLLLVVKVRPVAFTLGASILPIAIVVTFLWYRVQSRRMP